MKLEIVINNKKDDKVSTRIDGDEDREQVGVSQWRRQSKAGHRQKNGSQHRQLHLKHPTCNQAYIHLVANNIRCSNTYSDSNHNF